MGGGEGRGQQGCWGEMYHLNLVCESRGIV